MLLKGDSSYVRYRTSTVCAVDKPSGASMLDFVVPSCNGNSMGGCFMIILQSERTNDLTLDYASAVFRSDHQDRPLTREDD